MCLVGEARLRAGAQVRTFDFADLRIRWEECLGLSAKSSFGVGSARFVTESHGTDCWSQADWQPAPDSASRFWWHAFCYQWGGVSLARYLQYRTSAGKKRAIETFCRLSTFCLYVILVPNCVHQTLRNRLRCVTLVYAQRCVSLIDNLGSGLSSQMDNERPFSGTHNSCHQKRTTCSAFSSWLARRRS